MNDQMGLLWEWWACPTLGGKCGSEHCFVQLNYNNHFLLWFHKLESWAVAIVCGYSSVTCVDSLQVPDISLC